MHDLNTKQFSSCPHTDPTTCYCRNPNDHPTTSGFLIPYSKLVTTPQPLSNLIVSLLQLTFTSLVLAPGILMGSFVHFSFQTVTPGFYPPVRDLRRAATRRVIALQEVFDTIVSSPAAVRSDGFPPS